MTFLNSVSLCLICRILQNRDTSHNALGFEPVYRLKDEVVINPNMRVGLKQLGLDISSSSGFCFNIEGGFADLSKALRKLFPRLFEWLEERDGDDSTQSPFLICLNPPGRKATVSVFSTDKLPIAADIQTVGELVHNKVGIRNRVLFLGKLFR